MWIPSSGSHLGASSQSSFPTAVPNTPSEAQGVKTDSLQSVHETVQSVFVSTKCYDIMPLSNKAVVFETSISFYLAFCALLEHGLSFLVFLRRHGTLSFTCS